MSERDAAFADHFSGVARGYAAFRPRYPDALFAYLASVAPWASSTPSGSAAWDCGAGNGQASESLARFVDRVIATDASAAQIAAAAPHPRIEYRVAPAEASGLADGSVGLVTVAQALHWFDLPAFYREAARVLVPDGVLAVWSYGVQRLDDPRIDHALEQFYVETVGPYWPPERRLVETGYRTVAFPFVELVPQAFDMTMRWSLAELLGYVRTWSATTRYIEAHGDDPVTALAAALGPAWGEPDVARTVRWPLALRVGRRPASAV